MKLFKVVLALIIAVVIASPVMALGNADVIVASQSGHNNDQTTTVYQRSIDQVGIATQVGGHGNEMTISNTYSEDNSVSAASTTNFFEAVKLPANYYGLDAGVVTNYIASVYEGQVIVAANDQGSQKEVMSEVGDKYKYYVRSSVPVLAYVINMNDAPKAKWDRECAPKFDPYMDKFELGNLNAIFVGQYRSPSQQFEVTIPEKGRYALVIDTRVAHSLNGQTTKITDDTVDVTYFVEKTGFGVPTKFERTVVGGSNMYPILSNGMANTA